MFHWNNLFQFTNHCWRKQASQYSLRCSAKAGLLRYARLGHQTAVENVDYRAARGLEARD
jgi:hypothetical protein